MRNPSAPSSLDSAPNVTPMIDVLLVLLIIFMAAIPERRRALDGQLPADRTTSDGASGIVLEVARGGRYAVNRRPVPAERLGGELRALYAGRPEKVIIVKGARDARYQDVITAADVARGAGVRVVGFDTRR